MTRPNNKTQINIEMIPAIQNLNQCCKYCWNCYLCKTEPVTYRRLYQSVGLQNDKSRQWKLHVTL